MLWFKSISKAIDAFATMYSRPRQFRGGIPRKALKAAARLGDDQAAWELSRMSDNLRTTIVILAVVAGATMAGFFSWQGCVQNTQVQEERKLAETKAKAQLDMQLENDAHVLRQTYVQRCTLTPEQAERVVPGVQPPQPAKPAQ